MKAVLKSPLLSVRPSPLISEARRALLQRNPVAMASTTAGKDTLAQVSKDGELKRKDPIFRNHIAPGSEFEAESMLLHYCK